jgi:hypothetical protein
LGFINTKTDKDGQLQTDEKGAVLLETREHPRLLTELDPETAKLMKTSPSIAREGSFQSFTARPGRMRNSARCSISAGKKSENRTIYRGYLMLSSYSG